MQNTVIKMAAGSVASMNSQEVTDYLNDWYDGNRFIRHDNVKRTIERLCESNILRLPPMEDIEYINNLGAKCIKSVYVFSGERGRKDCITLVAQLSPEHTALIVERWLELEKNISNALPNFNNPVAAARAWADSEEKRLSAQAALNSALPKAEFVDRYVAGTGNITFRQAAKLLEVKEYLLRDFMKDNRVMYKLNGEWVPYQNHIDAGRFVIKTGQSQKTEHVFNQSLITPKGVEWLASKIGKIQ